MNVYVKDITGEISKFFSAAVELDTNQGILIIRYTDRKGSVRMRAYILKNLVSYESFVPVPKDEAEEVNDYDAADVDE